MRKRSRDLLIGFLVLIILLLSHSVIVALFANSGYIRIIHQPDKGWEYWVTLALLGVYSFFISIPAAIAGFGIFVLAAGGILLIVALAIEAGIFVLSNSS